MDDRLKNLDLRLLMLLKVLVKTKSTSLAAEELGVTQPTVSKGLDKLKAVFGEHLFIRQSRGIEPSEMAIRLAEATDAFLTPISNVLRDYEQFEPLEYSGSISIVANAILLEVIGGDIVLRLKKMFPKAKFEITSWNEHTITDFLEGKIDYGIQVEEISLPQDIYSQKIYSEDNVIFARHNHPAFLQSFTWEDVISLPLVSLWQPVKNYSKNQLNKSYQDIGYVHEIDLISSTISAANAFLKDSDAIMFGTETLFRLTDGLRCYSVPSEGMPIGKTVLKGCLLQTRRNHLMYGYLHLEMKKLFSTF
ncbi:LysR family transcriptional regulator [Vibrio kyushuensis]|uniref:LysR family transcriptional regulator n=1 Tax=Vibrio kyushuensis TaxID=2910249 RepID=UPI003D0FDAE4